jgi:hypothetical protein
VRVLVAASNRVCVKFLDGGAIRKWVSKITLYWSFISSSNTAEEGALPHHRRCGPDRVKPCGRTKFNPLTRRSRVARE